MKITLKETGLDRMMIGLLDQRHPALRELFDSAAVAAKIEGKAAAAKADATALLKAEGLDGDNLFGKTKATAIELAKSDNGPGNEPGIAGVTVLKYFAGRCAAEGLKDNTGRAMARLCAQTVEALRQSLVDEETVSAWTRPEAQTFFASDDAQARARVKAKVGELTKGCSSDYADQLLAHLLAFKYERTEGFDGPITGYHPTKADKAAAAE
jgi:hypothetical protein